MGFYERKDRPGYWKLEYYMGTGPKGKPQRKTKSIKAKNKREAEKAYHKFVAELEEKGFIQADNVTFRKFIEEHWYPYHKRVNEIQSSTLRTYITYIDANIMQYFGTMRLNQISKHDIRDFFDMIMEGRKPATLQKYKNILNSIFKKAVAWDKIEQNPIRDISIKGVKNSKDIEAYTIQEIRNILSIAEKENDLQWLIVIILALKCGLRRSEILALQWEYVDLEKKIITVTHSLTQDDNDHSKLIIKKTKTENVRKVPIPEDLVKLLHKQKIQKDKDKINSGRLWYDHDHFYVISDDIGKPFQPNSISKRWRRFRRRFNIRELTFHDLRHSCATYLYHQGLDAKIISYILGHADIKTTMNIYTHIDDSDIQRVMDVLELI